MRVHDNHTGQDEPIHMRDSTLPTTIPTARHGIHSQRNVTARIASSGARHEEEGMMQHALRWN